MCRRTDKSGLCRPRGGNRAVLEELFKALLHKLMTGEIRVRELDSSIIPDP